MEEKRGVKTEQIFSQKQLIQASLNCLLDETGLNEKTSLQVSYMKYIGRLAKLIHLHVWSFNSGSNYDTICLHWHQSVNLRSILTPKSFITKTKTQSNLHTYTHIFHTCLPFFEPRQSHKSFRFMSCTHKEQPGYLTGSSFTEVTLISTKWSYSLLLSLM